MRQRHERVDHVQGRQRVEPLADGAIEFAPVDVHRFHDGRVELRQCVRALPGTTTDAQRDRILVLTVRREAPHTRRDIEVVCEAIDGRDGTCVLTLERDVAQLVRQVAIQVLRNRPRVQRGGQRVA